ncbi:hypothetical protein BTB_502p05680 (plasmid) [Bacillus thuringiensis Bt407]|uniref:Uncharacterized protein n=2 Tax=Bacillus cereus group TaxID=86661 RepID=A0AAN4HK83_BACTU|nr:hypothetical protein [Bacillus thuringiensis]AFV21873.1 hypothetical protein BTB_502p05680 [Bacillus thuringiensis Bt407]MEC3071490.1 hypothetical protein [Bacillus cereus]PQZ77810.1 hypothetical protein CQ064_08130 [Bacillus sp. MYb78]ERI00949.1 hypothetical protein BTCBT_002504 [Bacillus thuringiensis T01-328]MBN6707715.1 hypothetical protein [Bacillus thuringiensis]
MNSLRKSESNKGDRKRFMMENSQYWLFLTSFISLCMLFISTHKKEIALFSCFILLFSVSISIAVSKYEVLQKKMIMKWVVDVQTESCASILAIVLISEYLKIDTHSATFISFLIFVTFFTYEISIFFVNKFILNKFT